MFDRRLVSDFDWTLFSLCLVLSVLGVVNLYSAGSAALSLNHNVTPHYLKQIYWLLVGLGLLAVTVTPLCLAASRICPAFTVILSGLTSVRCRPQKDGSALGSSGL